jgi:hypothetical protein
MSLYNRIDLIQLRPDISAEQRERLLRQAAPHGTQSLLRPTLPGVYNGGDLLWKSQGRDAAALPSPPVDAGLVAHVDTAVYQDGESGGDWNGPGIYRALLLSLKPGATPEAIARFECEVLAMPRYIGAIRAWRLSRVAQASGARHWSHVWEQRYDTLEGLTTTYMLHPYHWAWVDRWFDPESPDWIVDTHLCHSFCALDSMLSPLPHAGEG